MSKGEPPEKGWNFEKYITVTDAIFGIPANLSSMVLLFFSDRELPRWIFAAVLFLFSYRILRNVVRLLMGWWNCFRKKSRRLDRLYDRVNHKEIPEEKYGIIAARIIRSYEKSRNRVLKKWGIALTAGVLMLGLLCWFNPKNTSACAAGFRTFLTMEEETDPDAAENPADSDDPQEEEQKEETADDLQDEDVRTADQNENPDSIPAEDEIGQSEAVSEASWGDAGSEIYRQEKPEAYRFVLDEPDRAPVLNEKIKNQVFFSGIERQKNLTKNMNTFLKKLKEEKIEGIPCDQIQDEYGNNYSTYMIAEDNFKMKVDANLDWIYLDDWMENAPHSSELDAYIEGRERLNLIVTDEETEEQQDEKLPGGSENGSEEQSGEQLDEQRCWELWWKLANDYQYYAQEYEYQTQNDQAVLYYYTMSIYSCMEALKYEMPKETYDTIYDYMVSRYYDLGREDSIVSDRLKSLSVNIGSYLENFAENE